MQRSRGRRVAFVVGILALVLAGAALVQGATIPPSGTLDLRDAEVRLSGSAAGDEAGWSVAAAGDVNGDGVRDVLVGAPKSDPRGRADAGAVFVVFGAPDRTSVDLGNLGETGFQIHGANPGDNAGQSMISAGDVNGDGRDDLLVGAPRADPSVALEDAGVAYLVLGRTGTDPVDLGSPTATPLRMIGAAAGDQAGAAVGSIGDLNGDGTRELIVGAPLNDASGRTDAGSAYVVFGDAKDELDLGALGTDGVALEGPAGGFAGMAVSAVGDMTGDGRPEILVGAPTAGTRRAMSGNAYVVFGRAAPGTVDLSGLEGAGIELNGPEGSVAGASIAPLGDVNGDGLPDVVVGDPFADRHERGNSGSAYVVYGRAGAATFDLDALDPAAGHRIDGAVEHDWLGTSVGSAGDLNADGIDDVLISAPFANALSREDAGSTYVVYGARPGVDVDLAAIGEAGFRIAGADEGDTTRAAADVGDFDGDGVGDIVVGSPNATSPVPAPMAAPRRSQAGDSAGGAHIVLGPRPPAPPPPDEGRDEEEQIDNCRAVRNVEAVIDDSGSMFDSDPDLLRAQALKLILAKQRNHGKVLGAVEFGDEANQVFPPVVIEPLERDNEIAKTLELIDEMIQADNGSTNYNAGFAALLEDNPGAGARIFLTDGEHNAGEYADLHRGGPPTFVIGLGIGRRGGTAQRLARIAEETGGRYFPSVDSARLQAVLNAIDSKLNCDIESDHFVETGIEDDEREQDSTALEDGAHSAELIVSWDDPADEFEVDEIELIAGRRVLARASGRTIKRVLRRRPRAAGAGVGRLKLSGQRGSSFIALRVRDIQAGRRLRFTVRARKVRGRARLSTHVNQSRRRR